MNTFGIFDIHMITAFILYLIISVYVLIKIIKTFFSNCHQNKQNNIPIEEIEILIDDLEHVKTIKSDIDKR